MQNRKKRLEKIKNTTIIIKITLKYFQRAIEQ